MTFERANYSPDLAQFATERQSEYLNGIIKHGGAVIETFNSWTACYVRALKRNPRSKPSWHDGGI